MFPLNVNVLMIKDLFIKIESSENQCWKSMQGPDQPAYLYGIL